jgi:uncharacterized protein (TIGR02145 family)
MNRYMIPITAILLSALVVSAQNDTMYIMKNGIVVNKQSIREADVDSIIFHDPQIPPGKTFTDARDGNVYLTIEIGDQVWMGENLRYLPSVVGPVTGSATTPYYYVVGYQGTDTAEAKATSNYTTYGVLYNWPAAMAGEASGTANPSGVRGVCPSGWHLPSDAEWTELTDYLGGETVAGGKLKETGTTHWITPNIDATNESGFLALPSGYRRGWSGGGVFENTGTAGYWWAATEKDAENAKMRSVLNYGGEVSNYGFSKALGYCVRCVKD